MAPIKMAILPLMKKPNLEDVAEKLLRDLGQKWKCENDDAGSIGKRYRRQDEIGTPFCLTVDFDGLEDQTVTIRHRDSMKQERINVDQLQNYFQDQLGSN